MRSAPAIAFDVRPAPVVALALVLLAILALVAISISGLPPLWRSGLILATLIGAGLSIKSYLRPALSHVLWRSDDGCHIELRDGREHEAEMRGARVLGSWVFLRLAWSPRQSATVWLLGPNSDADVRRRLRVRIAAMSAPATTDVP